MPVESGAAYSEEPGDLGDSVPAGVIETLRVFDLLGGEFRRSPAL